MSTSIDVIKAAVETAKRERNLLEQLTNRTHPYKELSHAKNSLNTHNRTKQLQRYRQRILVEYMHKQDRSLYFTTFTFTNEYLNKNTTNCFNRFVEKLRRQNVSVEYCRIVEGGRLHYHCLLSLDKQLSLKAIRSAWNYGRADVQHMNDMNVVEYVMKAMTIDQRDNKPCKKSISFSAGFGDLPLPDNISDEDLLLLSRLHPNANEVALVIGERAAGEYELRTGKRAAAQFNPDRYSMREVWRGEVPFERICGPRYWVHDYEDPIRRWLEFINTKTRIAMEI